MDSRYLAGICDLSDFVITTEQSKETDSYHILILRVSAGKTIKNKVVIRRFMRHSNPTKCRFGTLALYLEFLFTDERNLKMA